MTLEVGKLVKPMQYISWKSYTARKCTAHDTTSVWVAFCDHATMFTHTSMQINPLSSLILKGAAKSLTLLKYKMPV